MLVVRVVMELYTMIPLAIANCNAISHTSTRLSEYTDYAVTRGNEARGLTWSQPENLRIFRTKGYMLTFGHRRSLNWWRRLAARRRARSPRGGTGPRDPTTRGSCSPTEWAGVVQMKLVSGAVERRTRDRTAAVRATERMLTCKKCTHARAIRRARVWSSTRPSYVSAGSSYVIELYPVHYDGTPW